MFRWKVPSLQLQQWTWRDILEVEYTIWSLNLTEELKLGKTLILIFLFLDWTTEKQTVLLPKEDKIWNGTYSSSHPIISPPRLQRKCCHSLEGFFGQMWLAVSAVWVTLLGQWLNGLHSNEGSRQDRMEKIQYNLWVLSGTDGFIVSFQPQTPSPEHINKSSFFLALTIV